jgi:hypothetical protein
VEVNILPDKGDNMEFYEGKNGTVVILNIKDGMVSFIGFDGFGKFATMLMVESNFHKMYHRIQKQDALYEALHEEVIKNINLKDRVKELENRKNELELQLKIQRVLFRNTRQNQWIQGDIIPDRVAKCSFCSQMFLSETTLPFFEHNPENPYDTFYCGCRGWN